MIIIKKPLDNSLLLFYSNVTFKFSINYKIIKKYSKWIWKLKIWHLIHTKIAHYLIMNAQMKSYTREKHIATKATIYLEYALPVQMKRPKNLHLVSFSSQKRVGIKKTIVCCSIVFLLYICRDLTSSNLTRERLCAWYKRRNIQKHCRS